MELLCISFTKESPNRRHFHASHPQKKKLFHISVDFLSDESTHVRARSPGRVGFLLRAMLKSAVVVCARERDTRGQTPLAKSITFFVNWMRRKK
jgi:hypothetical protein